MQFFIRYCIITICISKPTFTTEENLLKKLFALLAVLLLAINFTACRDISDNPEIPEEPVNYPVEIGSLIFEEAPATVASLSPALSEIICELGFEASLVGRSSYCDYPETLKTKTDIGSSANPDIDAIIKLKPQLLISQSPIAKKDITKIENAGTRVLILNTPKDFNGLKACYTDIARLLGGDINAEQAAENALLPLKTTLDDIKANQSADKTFAYLMTYDLATATGDTLAGNILSHFGTNIAAQNQAYNVSAEMLLEKQPDVLFLAAPMNAELLPEELKELTAIKQNQLIVIDNTLFERPTSRLKGTVDYILAKLGTLPPPQATEETPAETEVTAEE